MSWTKSIREIAEAIGVDAPDSDAVVTGVSTDTRTIKEGDCFFALSGPNFDANEFVADAFAKGAAVAVAQRASDAGPVICVDDSLRALQELATEHRTQFDIPITAITGSCGKTSVKDYIGALLETKYNVLKTAGNLNNEIGCPVTVLNFDDTVQHAVVEMGANHKGEIARLCEITRPTESMITMIGPAHLEGFGSIEDVAKAKAEIMEGLGGEGTFFVNGDDARCVAIGARHSGRTVVIGSGGRVRLRGTETLQNGEFTFDIDPIGTLKLPLPTPKLINNVLIAVAVGLDHGVEEFEGPLRSVMENRGRVKRIEIGPYVILDDSYNANPASMSAAIDALSRVPREPKAAVLGDMLEMGDVSAMYHKSLGEEAVNAGVSTVITRGDFAHDTISGARAGGAAVAEVVDEHEAMADALMAAMPNGGAVLVKGSRGMRMERVIDALRKKIDSNECSIS